MYYLVSDKSKRPNILNLCLVKLNLSFNLFLFLKKFQLETTNGTF